MAPMGPNKEDSATYEFKAYELHMTNRIIGEGRISIPNERTKQSRLNYMRD